MHFLYRSHYDGPLSKRVRHLPDETVLAWFRRGWACADPEAWVREELGGDVYYLDEIFTIAQDQHLPPPENNDELRALLREHLYVEDPDDIRLDEHTLRVRTDDDEVELAYFFLDERTATGAPDRLAYPLHDSWPLPEDAGGGRPPFSPQVPVAVATPGGTGDATTFAVFLTFYDGESMAHQEPLAFPGIALPELAHHLTTASPDADWPPELSVLRALTAPGETTLRPALERCNRWPGFNNNADPWPAMPDAHDAAHHRALEMVAAGEFTHDRRPEDSLLRVGDHLAQFAIHCMEPFGFQQWYLFDTIWSATHPSLAQSLLRYANHWDPLDD